MLRNQILGWVMAWNAEFDLLFWKMVDSGICEKPKRWIMREGVHNVSHVTAVANMPKSIKLSSEVKGPELFPTMQ